MEKKREKRRSERGAWGMPVKVDEGVVISLRLDDDWRDRAGWVEVLLEEWMVEELRRQALHMSLFSMGSEGSGRIDAILLKYSGASVVKRSVGLEEEKVWYTKVILSDRGRGEDVGVSFQFVDKDYRSFLTEEFDLLAIARLYLEEERERMGECE